MPKDDDDGSSLLVSAATKLARIGTSRFLASSSSSRYRLPVDGSNESEAPSTRTPANGGENQLGAPHRVASTLRVAIPASSAAKSPTRSPPRVAFAEGSDASENPAEPQQQRAVLLRTVGGSSRGKLPLRIRQSISRMRSQEGLPIGGSLGGATASPVKPEPSGNNSRSPLRQGSVANVAVALAGQAGPRYSRQSQMLQSLQGDLTERKKSTRRRGSSIRDGGSDRRGTSSTEVVRASMGSPQRREHTATLITLLDLLRPLQHSMRGLHGDWDQRTSEEDDPDEDEDEADARFRQMERESSRIVRICCSLDNLLFAIGDKVQEKKDDLVAIAEGPARELVQLLSSGLKQIAETMSDPVASGGPSLSAKEEQYLHDFMVEIAARWGKLDDMIRTIYASALEQVRQQHESLQTAYNGIRDHRDRLEVELLELREFHNNQNASTMAVTSNFMRLTDQRTQNGPEVDEESCNFELSRSNETKPKSEVEELAFLRTQCQEYARLLEMAKQEIRLSHQERQAQHHRLMELSQTLLKDQEVTQLRNEVHAEKKRVKNLEMENLSLREVHVDLNLKIQSLLVNQPSSTATSRNGKAADASDIQVRSATPAESSGRRNSMNSATVIDQLSLNQSDVQDLRGKEISCSFEYDQQPRNEPIQLDVGAAHSWFHRIMNDTMDRSNGSNLEPDDGLIRGFLVSILPSNDENAMSLAVSSVRKDAQMASLRPPQPAPRVAQSTNTKPRKRLSGPTTPLDTPLQRSDWAADEEVVRSVRHFLWFFYELYLMKEEARAICEPCPSVVPCWNSNVLASLVLPYFLRRSQKIGTDDLDELRRFVSVLMELRESLGDVQLFCEALEGTVGVEELNFLLWVLQAVDTVAVGISYDAPISSPSATDSHRGPYICSLKALYITRMVYRLFQMKSHKRPAMTTATATTSSLTVKARPTSAQAPMRGQSPKRKRGRNRPASAAGLAHNRIIEQHPENEPPQNKQPGIVERTRIAYRQAVAENSGCPLTLESLNSLVLSLATPPTDQELIERVGPFYCRTGDERKLPLDLFLVLLMESFTTQLQWRKTQLRSLFMRLSRDEEIGKILSAQKLAEEKQQANAATSSGRSRGKTVSTRDETRSPSKKSKHVANRGGRRAVQGSDPDKYLIGINRGRFRQFLVEGGLVQDTDLEDIENLYVETLQFSGSTPTTITFDQIYEALRQLNRVKMVVNATEFSTWASVDPVMTDNVSKSATVSKEASDEIATFWKVYATGNIALCEHDPNQFVRNHSRRLIRNLTRCSTQAPPSTNESNQQSPRSNDCVQMIREFLSMAYRLASRRMLASWCLSEFYMMNQALTMMWGMDSHYLAHMQPIFEHGTATCESIPESKLEDLVNLVQTTRSIHPGDSQHSQSVESAALVVIWQRFAVHFSQLYASFSSTRYNGIGLTQNEWLEMASELGIVCKKNLTSACLEQIFLETASGRVITQDGGRALIAMKVEEISLTRAQFVELLTRTAIVRHVRKQNATKDESIVSVSAIMLRFCLEIIAPKAFATRGRLQEGNFRTQLNCPLVMKSLLEHRAYLRTLFYSFATTTNAVSNSFATRSMVVCSTKSARNTMTREDFVEFLRAMDLLEEGTQSPRPHTRLVLDTAGAGYLFVAVMAVEVEDTTRMEFEEFTAAIAALAAWRNPHPFVAWYLKIDQFVSELHERHKQIRGQRQM